MAGINKAIVIGNLGQDPEVRNTKSGETVCNLNIATSERWRDRNSNEPIEKTEWHRVSVFGKSAVFASEYLMKGSKVYIEGKLQTRKWQDQSGADRYTTEIVVAGYGGILQALDKKNGSNQDPELEDIPF
tara:strand:+ start:6357 stop:6746 length:390 start_codon:yes stop_codon:yes gene_type:complete